MILKPFFVQSGGNFCTNSGGGRNFVQFLGNFCTNSGGGRNFAQSGRNFCTNSGGGHNFAQLGGNFCTNSGGGHAHFPIKSAGFIIIVYFCENLRKYYEIPLFSSCGVAIGSVWQ